jgi:2-keto-4-pentenoate hydratase/2-oxohepta-3-ene-1,7-dioic acid hydratase in catechol pathway
MQFSLATLRESDGSQFVGIVVGHQVLRLAELHALGERLGSPLRCADDMRDLFVCWSDDFSTLQRLVTAAIEGEPAVERRSPHEFEVSAPFVPPQTFCAVGNFRSHLSQSAQQKDAGSRLSSAERKVRDEQMFAKRLEGEPYMCFKLPSTIAGPNDVLLLHPEAKRVDWELELGVVISRRCRNVTRAHAMELIAGYTIVNDITARDAVFRKDVPHLGTDWLASKNAPGFLPLGPLVVPAAFIADPYALRMTLRLNGTVMQDELVSDMLFDIAAQIEYISRHAVLLPGDVICTGTPGGCGTHVGRFLKPGDEMEATIAGLGTQRIRVAAECPASAP